MNSIRVAQLLVLLVNEMGFSLISFKIHNIMKSSLLSSYNYKVTGSNEFFLGYYFNKSSFKPHQRSIQRKANSGNFLQFMP